MADAEWVQWFMVIGGALIAGALVWLACWGLFQDRARGRRRCPRCWYDMTYTEGMRCSECGHTVRREKDLHKTRRRKIAAVPAIMLVTALGVYVIDRGRTQGWMSYIPNSDCSDRPFSRRCIKKTDLFSPPPPALCGAVWWA